jgi:hypothetical protein
MRAAASGGPALLETAWASSSGKGARGPWVMRTATLPADVLNWVRDDEMCCNPECWTVFHEQIH